MSDNIKFYYVYLHKKFDTDEVFYVGKGKGARYKSNRNRNKHWHNVVNKHGLKYEILVSSIDEELAMLCEIELIDKYKKLNICLCNYTNGGDGVSGYKHTAETIEKMKQIQRQRVINSLHVGTRGMKFSEESKLKMSIAKRGKLPPNAGIPHTEETKRKMSIAKLGFFKSKYWWTDGVTNIRREYPPSDSWKRGQTRK